MGCADYVLRLVKANTELYQLSSICGDICKNCTMCCVYQNISKEMFNKITNDSRIESITDISIEPTSNVYIRHIRNHTFTFVKSLIKEYIKKDGQNNISEKSIIDELKKFRKECEDMMKECIYTQLGEIFVREKVDYFYDIMQKKSDYQNDIFRDYICAKCECTQLIEYGEKFDLRTCANKYAKIVIEENYNLIINYISNEICPSYTDRPNNDDW